MHLHSVPEAGPFWIPMCNNRLTHDVFFKGEGRDERPRRTRVEAVWSALTLNHKPYTLNSQLRLGVGVRSSKFSGLWLRVKPLKQPGLESGPGT